jgi:hypothetical protein
MGIIHTETTDKVAADIKTGDVIEIGEVLMRVDAARTPNTPFVDTVILDLVEHNHDYEDARMATLVLEVQMTIAVQK